MEPSGTNTNSPDPASESASRLPSASRSWLRALALTDSIAKNVGRLLANVIDEQTEAFGEAPALLAPTQCMSYGTLAGRSNRFGRWALQQKLGKQSIVCLLMPNRPEYFAIWLGVSRTGCTVALVNTNLTGASLAHSIDL